jgi:hypothetical protein
LSVPAVSRRLAAITTLVVATLVSYREILLPTWVLSDYDIWVYFYPLRAYAARALSEGRFPLWNPDTFMGSPFFANPQTSLLYPGTALFYVLPLGYAYSLSVVLHVALAAIFMYAFLHWAWRMSAIAAFVGAAAFAFGGFLSSQVGHINQLSASAWLPAIVLCADMALTRRSVRWAVAGAITLGVQLLAGHAQESYMTVWAVGIVLVFRGLLGQSADAEPLSQVHGFDEPGDPARRKTQRPAARELLVPATARRLGTAFWVGCIVIGIGFGLAAAQLVPTAELSARSIRGGGMSDAEAISFSLLPTSLVRSVLPGYWFNLGSEEIGYIGAIGLGFAALGLLFGRWRLALCAFALCFVGLFFALGGANPLYVPLLHHVPGLGLFRVPSRWLFVYTFGATSLAALGVDWAFGQRAAVRARAAGRLTREQADPDPTAQSGPTSAHAAGRITALRTGPLARRIVVGVLLVALVLLALPFARMVPGRIVLLWLLGLGAALVMAAVALRWRLRWTAPVLAVLVLVELVFAAMDLPQRYPAPAMVLDGDRPVPTYHTQRRSEARILSIAPTEYPLEDEAQLMARFPLAERARFFFTADLKLDAVMSPNVSLRYRLATADGYDGGVLPLRQYLRMASLLVPPDEIRPDGVLRTRMIAVPDIPFWKMFNIDAVIANQAFDVELDGVRFDVATARRIESGNTVRIEMPGGAPTQAISLLGSIESEPGTAGEGRMVVTRADGSRDDIPLRIGTELFRSNEPGPLHAPQPTAGLSREGRMDTAVRIPLASGEPVTAIEWSWQGAGVWALRGATLIGADGSPRQLLLQPGLKRTLFPVLKVYEPDTRAPSSTALVPGFEVLDDDDAFDRLSTMTTEEQDRVVVLAPDQGPPPAVSGAGSQPARFTRVPGPPERLVYQRTEGTGDGYLLVNDAWFPGWRAEIDGAATPIYRANLNLKAVYVPAGARTVTLTYAPRSVVVGAVASMLFVALALVLFFHRRILRLVAAPFRRGANDGIARRGVTS